MKKETKDNIVFATSMVFTVSTSVMAGWAAGWGAIALADLVFKEGLKRSEATALGSIITVGSVGVGYLVAQETYPKFVGFMQDVMDIFPTDPKEVKDAE